jgi:hypothetical protein
MQWPEQSNNAAVLQIAEIRRNDIKPSSSIIIDVAST